MNNMDPYFGEPKSSKSFKRNDYSPERLKFHNARASIALLPTINTVPGRVINSREIGDGIARAPYYLPLAAAAAINSTESESKPQL